MNRIAGQHHSLTQPRHPATGQFVKQRANGKSQSDPASTLSTPMVYGLNRILRPQAAFRWILPNLAAITPQYIEMILRGALAGNHVQQWELFDLMFDTWPELAACNQELVYGVLRKKLVYEPYHEEDEKPSDSALERMKVVSTALRRMEPDPASDDCALDGTIKDTLDGWFRGVTVSEVIWQTLDDPDVGTIAAPKSTFWVHPVCFAFNPNGILGLRPTKPYDNSQWPYPSSTLTAQPQTSQLIPFPEHKFLIAIHKAKSGTALGGPLLRPLAWWWCAANFSSDWLLNLAQLFGLPFRWANYDPNAPQATIDRICDMLQNMGSAGYAAFPTGTTLEMMTSGKEGSDHSPQGELLDRADRYARMLILGQTMTGTHGTMGKGGGQAFGKVEKDVKEDRIDAAGKFAASVINRQLINSILMLNYGDTEEAPQIRFLEEEEAGLVEAQRDQVLIKIGLPVGTDFLRKKYGIPEPSEGEEVLGGQPEMAGDGFGSFGRGNGQDVQSIDDQNVNEDQAAQGKAISAQGDKPGHEFHGNQWTARYAAEHEIIKNEREKARAYVKEIGLKGEHAQFVEDHAVRRLVEGSPFGDDTNGEWRGRISLAKSDHEFARLLKIKRASDPFLEDANQQNELLSFSKKFPSILQSEEDKRRKLINAGIQTKLADINAIEDDAIYSEQLSQLAEEIKNNAS